MATPTIPNGEEYFFPVIYEGNGTGQRVGKFVPFTDNGTIDNSCIFNSADSPVLSRTPSGTGTSKKIFTISAWIKNGRLINSASNHSRVIYGVNHGGGSRYGIFGLYNGGSGNADKLRLFLGRYTTGSSTTYVDWYTNRTLEDTSKWYHVMAVVDTTDATAGDRVKLYIDGDRVTSFASSSNPNLNDEFYFGSEYANYISTYDGSFGEYDGYIAEFNFVDGTALGPDTFGVTDTSTGRWIPKTLSGITYGTNGFRLKFQDSSALGDDTSGNTNDFTATNLASTDQTTDSPTQNFNNMGGSDTGSFTKAEGNLKITVPGSGIYEQCVGLSSFGVSSGKWYWEVTVNVKGATGYGWKSDDNVGGAVAKNTGGSLGTVYSVGGSGGFTDGEWTDDYSAAGSNFSPFTTASVNDVIMFALDLDNQKGYVGLNGTWFNSANPANGTGSIGLGYLTTHSPNAKFYPMCLRLNTTGTGTYNFGQKSFAYTAPTGFSAWNQDNLPSTDRGVTGMVWIKNRDEARSHVIYDSSRGPGQKLQPDKTNEDTLNVDGVTRFLKGGVAVGSQNQSNDAGDGNVAWNWVANSGTTSTNTDGSVTSTVQVNTTAGFSIVKWTGGGSAATVGHGLSQTPEWIFYKRTSAAGDGWITYHTGQNASPANGSLQIQSDGTFNSDSTLWNNTAPTSSVISIGSYGMGSGEERTAWVWHSVDGFSKFGKYVGNGSADGPFVYLGFRPAFVCIKRLTAGYHWTAKDTTRDPINPMTRDLKWNLSAGDNVDANNAVDFLSNGFKIRSASSGATNYNGSGATHIYMAWAEHPFVGDGTSPVTAR